ncbi:unnamed protein product, partial [Rotaria sp. Silwood2]
MSAHAPATIKNSTFVAWMWQSNPNPWSKTEKPEWSLYSDMESIIIEKAYATGQTDARIDGFYIVFKQHVQISDQNKRRPVKRVVCKSECQYLRQERFMHDPIAPTGLFGEEYGWVSPMILEVRKNLNLKEKQLPSKDETIVSMVAEKAAQ